MSDALPRFTRLLQDRKEELLRDWIARLRAAPDMPHACCLGDDDLRNYVPKLLDDLVASLAQSADAATAPGAAGPEIGAAEAARVHVKHRYAQGCSLAEELAEFRHLRAAVLALCAREGVVLAGAEAELVHSALDELMNTAALEMEAMRTAGLRRDIDLYQLFVAVLGHDLRNPLTAVRFSTAALLGREDVPEPVLRALQRITSSAERMERLVADLLDMTRVRVHGGLPISRRACDLRVICEQVIGELCATHPGGAVDLRADGDTRGVWDPDRLAQMASNLVGNALKHGAAEGRHARVDLRGEQDRVLVQVNNAGSVAPEVMDALFDPFRRGGEHPERRAGGLGLGLFIVNEIVKAHGGVIAVTSDLATGTTFLVTLPRGG